MFAYCDNNPANKVDRTGQAGQYIELGNGWYCRIDPADTAAGTKRHIHIWNGRKEYIQNDDGSPHDKHRGESGKIPKWLNKKLIERLGWDYNGKRSTFFNKTVCNYQVEYVSYTFADGTTVCRSHGLLTSNTVSINSFESIYYTSESRFNSSASNAYIPVVFLVPFPTVSFGFSFGWCVVQWVVYA